MNKPESEQAGETSPGGAGSRRWRSLWRLHFYSGMFAMPFILFMAVTGLVILYTQPLQDLTQGDLRKVDDSGEWLPFDQQVAAVSEAYPAMTPISLTTPVDSTHATIVGLDDGSDIGQQAFVNPYTAGVLGKNNPDGDIVALSNRLHGYLNNDSVTIPLPAVAWLWEGGDLMRDYVLGDLVLEILGVWTLMLVLSGLYLWWPRRSRHGSEARNGRRFLGLRLHKAGRARWRDLHGLAGVVLFAGMVLTIVSGLAWSTYWSEGFSSLASEISPPTEVGDTSSTLGVRGDLDRLGNRIPWNTGDFPIPASYATPADGTLPRPLALNDVVAIAETEGMLPGYTVYFPSNEVDESGATVYGSFLLSNSWPRKTGEARDLYLDQFSGETLAELDSYGVGPISYGMDTLVSTHMGTQLGLFSRILMTLVCVLASWSVISALVMYTKRRRPGTLGLPRRPVNVRLTRGVVIIAVALGIVFPQWGASALLVLAIDRFVIRRVRPLRVAFGQTA
jgi:uncharacterized iron-regulated membrane protein